MTMWKHWYGLWQLLGNWRFNVDATWAGKELEKGCKYPLCLLQVFFLPTFGHNSKSEFFQNHTITLRCENFSGIDSSTTYVLRSFRLFLKSTVLIWCVASTSGVYHPRYSQIPNPDDIFVPMFSTILPRGLSKHTCEDHMRITGSARYIPRGS